MQSHRIISGLTILVMIVLVVAGYLLVAQPQLAAASTANDSLASTNAQIANAESTITQLKSQQQKLPSLKAQLAKLRESVPSSADISSYIDSLNALASASGVTLTALKVDPAVSYTPPVAAVAPATSSSATPTPTPAPTASAAASAPVATMPTGWTPTTDTLITASNFVAIPLTITTSGEWPETLAFIHGLQSGSRLFLVTAINTTADSLETGQAAVSATINGYVYVVLDPKADALAADTRSANASPTPTPTPTVSSSPNPSGSSTPTPTTSPTPTKKP